MKRTILPLVILFISSSIFAQIKKTIKQHPVVFTGVVVDIKSQAPLNGVNISIGSLIVGHTDTEGRFSIAATHGDTIKISYIGYNEKNYIVSDTLQLHMYNIGFALSEKEYEIETVIVFPSGDYNAMKSQILNMPLDKNIENANRNFRNSKYQALTHQPAKLDADAITQRTIRGFGYKASETGTVAADQSFNAIMIPLFLVNLIKDMNKPEVPAPIKMEQHSIYNLHRNLRFFDKF